MQQSGTSKFFYFGNKIQVYLVLNSVKIRGKTH